MGGVIGILLRHLPYKRKASCLRISLSFPFLYFGHRNDHDPSPKHADENSAQEGVDLEQNWVHSSTQVIHPRIVMYKRIKLLSF